MNEIKLFAKKKGSSEKPQPIKGLLYYKPSPFTNYVRDTNPELITYIKMPFKQRKELEAIAFGFTRISPIKRTRKRQIAKAKHMLALRNHTSYEWSQWWKQSARKPKRWK